MWREVLELRVPPLALTTAAGVGMVFLPVPRSPRLPEVLAWSAWTAVIAIGVTIAVLGVIAFRRASTTLDPRYPERTERIVRNGIYARTRNPMYVGFVAMLLGLAVALQSPLGLVVALATGVFFDRFQIGPEERALLGRFGSDFEHYRRAVPRWL